MTALHVVKEEPLRPFFTVYTLAEYLSISERTVRQMLIDGEIASYMIGGSRRVDPADLEDYLRSRRQNARAERRPVKR
jgi:excisionase family DNA binding protein